VELVQSGLYDFNLNSRGFNGFYNRHVLTRIDGRDPSIPTVLGHVDWATLSNPLDDFDQLEFVRGPGAALYGAGAFNGVMNLRTKAPRDSLGGRARYTTGELGTHRIEFRQALSLGRDWYLKGVGGYHRSGDFTRSRVGTGEYAPATLPRDLAAPSLDKVRLSFGSVRIDRYTTPERLLTFELGTANQEGPVKVSPVGRVQATDVDSPWFRVNFAAPRWNVVAYYTGIRMDATRNLTANALIYLQSSQMAIEAQTNRQFAGGRGRLVAGLEVGGQTANSVDPNGVQTASRRICLRRCPTMPPVVRSSHCCPSVISARPRRPALSSARPICCQRAGGSRARTRDFTRTSATYPRIRCYPTLQSISSAPWRRTGGVGLAVHCGTGGWIRSNGCRGYTEDPFPAMTSSISTAAIG
jgi:outer membrane receptor protein involved in Fe transport